MLKKWYTIYKDNIRLSDYEVRAAIASARAEPAQIHDGMSLEMH